MSKKSIAKKITYGVFATLVDLLLYQIYICSTSVGKSGSKGVYQAFSEADKMLEEFNHHTIAVAFHRLRKNGLLSYGKRKGLNNLEITDFGKERLRQITPHYLKKRPWDGKIYLITYDIPENARTKRNCFRRFIQSLHCRLFQESIWLTPYNPRQLIREFVNRNNIPGMIIVSDIGADGGIGEGSLEDLIVRLYCLEELNDRYGEFIKKTEQNQRSDKYLIFEYLSILKDDPQLPFTLLPRGWLGERAYQKYTRLTRICNFQEPHRIEELVANQSKRDMS
jgi:DNA-binding transcriptional regulator PaaX